MPTPVSIARQCLADEAAAALDDAVSVAKRRGHVQTTSLHAVSALLSLPSSLLRDACSRASGRGGACPTRLQLRALDLCVGVALDRVPTSKCPVDDDPPVSNSLMAAIKRSQANQRRNPETFHLYQQQQMMNPDSDPSSSFNSSVVRVDLKNFVMSILDDPNVSRVFGDAGFRNQEIKCAILNPSPLLRFPGFPPLLGDFGAKSDHLTRIGEIMMKKERRNPLLIGACADDALKAFLEDVKRGEIVGNLEKMSLVSIETEVAEFLGGGLSEEVMGLRFEEVCEMVGSCAVLMSFGDMKVFANMEILMDKVDYIVGEMKKLLSEYGGRLWWIGSFGGDSEYKKLLERFPEIEEEWDLHLLPITGYTSSGRKGFKSSLMGSFVPLGGFFPLPSEHETQSSRSSQSSDICSSCNQKYEKEVDVLQKVASSNVDADHHSVTLSPWLKTSGQVLAKDAKTSMDAKIVALWRKWTDICQQLHHSWTSKEDVSPSKTQTHSVLSFCNVPTQRDSARFGSPLNTSEVSNPSHCMPLDLNHSLQDQTSPEHVVPYSSPHPRAEVVSQCSKLNDALFPSSLLKKTSLHEGRTASEPVTSVATDLGLGTFSSSKKISEKPSSRVNHDGIRNSLGSIPTIERTHSQVWSPVQWGNQMGKKDLEYPWKVLAEKVHWQIEAVKTIGQTLTCHRNDDGVYTFLNKGNVWLSFLGQDKVGKKQIAAAVADIIFGNKQMSISFDLSSSKASQSTVFDCCDSKSRNVKSERKTIVDSLAEELNKHPRSVVMLDNVEKADTLVQNSLFQSIKNGKFQDSHGRDINVNNMVFILSSRFDNSLKDHSGQVTTREYSEEEIIEAKNFEMQLIIGSPKDEISHKNKNSSMNVFVSTSKVPSNQWPVKKRKLTSTKYTNAKMSRSFIDLNLPVEDTEYNSDIDKHDDDDDSFESLENPETWLNELLELVDQNVHFKSLNCDSIALNILNKIDTRLNKIVGTDTFLEIDREVMHQIIAAALLTDGEAPFNDWIDNVLCSSIKEARQRQSRDTFSNTVMRLVSCEGLIVEEHARGLCLPAKIRMN